MIGHGCQERGRDGRVGDGFWRFRHLTVGHAMVTLRDGGDTAMGSALFKIAPVACRDVIFYSTSIPRSSDVKWLRYRPSPWLSASRVEANVNIDLRGLPWPVGQGHVPLSSSTQACTGHSTKCQVPSAKCPSSKGSQKAAASHFPFSISQAATTTTEQAERRQRAAIVTSWQVQTSTL